MPRTPLDLIGTAETSRILGIAIVTVTRWVQEGQLPAVGKLPGKNGALLFDRADIERIAAQRAAAERAS